MTAPLDTAALRARYNGTASILAAHEPEVLALCDALDAARAELAAPLDLAKQDARWDGAIGGSTFNDLLVDYWKVRAELARLRPVVRAAVAEREADRAVTSTLGDNGDEHREHDAAMNAWRSRHRDYQDAVAAFVASEPKALPPIEEWPSTDGQWSTRNAGTASEPKAKSDDWTPTTTSERYNGKPLVQASEPKREGAQVGEATPAAGDQAARCTRCGGYINRHDSDCDQRETPPALTRAQARTLLVELEHGPYDGETYTEHYTREMEKQIKDSIAALRRIAEDV
jgi:hypothetical protein